MSVASITKRTLTMEIVRIDEKAQYITKLKDEAIETLLNQKKSLMKESNDDIAKSTSMIETTIDEVQKKYSLVMEQYATKQIHLHEDKKKLDDLKAFAEQIEKELIIVQQRHKIALQQLQEKRLYLEDRLQSIEKMDNIVSTLEKALHEAQATHSSKIQELQKRRGELLRTMDVPQNEVAKELSALDMEMDERERKHTLDTNEIKNKIEELKSDANLSLEHLNNQNEEISNEIKELENAKINSSPSELLRIEQRVAGLREQSEECENLIGLMNLSAKEKIINSLERQGLSLTPSGNVRTDSGKILTLEEAKLFGFLDGLDDNLMRLFSMTFKNIFVKPSESESLSSSSATTMSEMSSADVHYLKTVLGKPLTVALAEITAKQPRDPIHYLGHWLFKYRYNQELDESRNKELEELLQERERLTSLAFRQHAEEEAKATLMELLGRVDTEVHHRQIEEELRRIEAEAIMEEAENEVLEMEALDTLGVYDGPTSGQKL